MNAKQHIADVQITEDDEQRTFHFECSSSTGPLGGLQAEIIASKRRSSAAEIIFRKDAPLTEDDIRAMSSAMHTANTLIKPVSIAELQQTSMPARACL